MTNEQIRLTLRAFNGECDAAIGKVKYNNIDRIETRITKCYEAMNKMGATKQVRWPMIDGFRAGLFYAARTGAFSASSGER